MQQKPQLKPQVGTAKKAEQCADIQNEPQFHRQVPISSRPRFMNQIMSRHRNRRRTEAKRKTRGIKFINEATEGKGHEERENQKDRTRENVGGECIFEEKGQDDLQNNKMKKSLENGLQKKTTYIHGNKIQGTWKNGVLHGDVIIQYETKEYFQGKYQNGIRVYGLVRFKDGTQYQGGFLKDIFHGQGSLKDPTGRKIICQWQLGQPAQKAKIQYPSGDIYVGQIRNLKKHGQGYLFFKNGSKYIGKFVNGQITGYGCYYEHDQKIAEGIWENGVLEVQEDVRVVLMQTLRGCKVGGFRQLDGRKSSLKVKI